MRHETAPAGSKPLPDMMESFLDLACALSPENLSCDGELPPAETARRRNELLQRWQKLEADFGRQVSEDEVWEWERNKARTPRR